MTPKNHVKINFLPNSYASNILFHVALAVEFPWKSIDLLPGDRIQNVRCLKLLKDEKYISVHEKGKFKSIRLTKKALPVLDKISEGLYDTYMFNSDNHSYRGAPKNDKTMLIQMLTRKHRLGELYCLGSKINCRMLFGQKPELTLEKRQTISDELLTPIIYNSRELKRLDPEQMHKTEFSRLLGMIISAGGYYNVYSVNNGRFKWNQYGEGKAKILTEDVINANFSCQFPSEYGARSDSAIMLASSFSAAAEILNNEYHTKDSRGFEFLSFDNTYPNIHLLPVDLYGALQLRIITSENYHSKMMKILFGNSEQKVHNLDCDVVRDEKYILSMLDGNIGRLKRFVMGLYSVGASNGSVLCFSWQEEVIREIVGDSVSIQVIDMNEFALEFFGGDDNGE